MRLWALLFTALAMTPASAAAALQDKGQPSSSTAKSPSAQEDAKPLELPVSLDRIKDALAQPPVPPLLRLDQQPHFKVEVQEHRKLEELIATLDFKSGPTPPGGIYGYEQQRLAFPSVDRPLMQPYAAFSTGELLTIALENLIAKYLGGRAINAITTAERERAERAAREEVAHAMAEFCAAQPNLGAGLQSCSVLPDTR